MKTEIEPELQKHIEVILKEIGNRIRTKRKSLTPNYEIFAADNHLNKVTVSRAENGKDIKISTLILILHKMDVSLEDFFRDIK